MSKTAEIEVRFLNINPQKLIAKLLKLGAKDHGKKLLKEVIFYDQKLLWPKEGKVVRLRQHGKNNLLAFKHHHKNTIDGAIEVEFSVDDVGAVGVFLELIGLRKYRIQEKKRHSFLLHDTTIDIDTWPTMPPYVEIEGTSEDHLKKVSKLLDLDWSNAVFENAKIVIEKYYNIPVSKLSHFTFEKIE